MPNSPEFTSAEVTGPRLVGYALQRVASLEQGLGTGKNIRKVAEQPKSWRADYPQEVIDAYEKLVEWAKTNASDEDSRETFVKLSEYLAPVDVRASGFKKEDVVSVVDPNDRDSLAKALHGLNLVVDDAAAEMQERMHALTEQQMPDSQDRYQEALLRRFGDRYGIKDISAADSGTLTALFGNLLAISPEEASRYKFFVNRLRSLFGTGVTDYLDMAFAGMGSKEGGYVPDSFADG